MKKTCYKKLYNWLTEELVITDDVSDTEKCELVKLRILAIKFALNQGERQKIGGESGCT